MINITPMKEHEIIAHTHNFASAVASAIADLSGIGFVQSDHSAYFPKELTLNEITVFTNFTGTVQGNYAINMDASTAASILNIPKDSSDFDGFACGLFEEVVNVATGRVIELLKVQYGFLTFNSPVISHGKIRFPNYRNCTMHLDSEHGNVLVNFAINMANLEITDKLLATMKNLRKQQSISYKDALTDIYNRAYFEYFKAKLFGHKRPLSLIIFDVDKFKDINDTYGHSCGDAALQHIANCVVANVRDTDIPIRYGGDEFIILLEESPIVGAFKLVERISSMLCKKRVPIEGPDIFIEISAGISEHVQGEDFAQLFSRADTNLYKAKNAGRNQACGD